MGKYREVTIVLLGFIIILLTGCRLEQVKEKAASSKGMLAQEKEEKELPSPSPAKTDRPLLEELPAETEMLPDTETPEETETPPETKLPSPSASREIEKKEAVKVKGIYVTGPKAGSDGMTDLIELVENTRLNAMVIDVKNDAGEITFRMDTPMVKQIGSSKNYISHIEDQIKELKDKGIYLIARVVAFKDPILAEKMPDLALKKKDGKIFRDKSGLAWVNPYHTKVWDYLYEVCEQAALLGFDEIQFDYVRFSTDSLMKEVDFSKEEGTKQEAITAFITDIGSRLKRLNVFVSADVYGIVINSAVDQEIVGQNYADMARELDYICPMIYPSHYAEGSYGIDYPDQKPYEIIYKVLTESKLALAGQENTAIVRPWLQDFTASWLKHYKKYGKEEVEAQIRALEDAGYEEWILWNGGNRYTRLDD